MRHTACVSSFVGNSYIHLFPYKETHFFGFIQFLSCIAQLCNLVAHPVGQGQCMICFLDLGLFIAVHCSFVKVFSQMSVYLVVVAFKFLAWSQSLQQQVPHYRMKDNLLFSRMFSHKGEPMVT